ncbi:MAG: hypothetical protein AABZ67_02920 [Pseudomonadota bacterium]
MTQPLYRDARRVFWIMDNGSSHRGRPCVRRLTEAFANLVPVHASWLNQIEIYFSIVQRKALTPNDFSCLARSKIDCCASRNTTKAWLRPSTGGSHEMISQD